MSVHAFDALETRLVGVGGSTICPQCARSGELLSCGQNLPDGKRARMTMTWTVVHTRRHRCGHDTTIEHHGFVQRAT